MSQIQWFYDEGGSRIGPVAEEDIKALVRAAKIRHGTLVWCTGMTDWVAVESSMLNKELDNTPPPLSQDRISDLWAWLLALLPIVWLMIDTSMLSAGLVVFWLTTIAFCAMDISRLRQAGYKAPTIWWSFFGILIPVYLYLRSKRLKSNYGPLVVWILTNVALVIVPR